MTSSESDDNPLSRIELITAIHPDNKPYFDHIATPKKVVREGRGNIDIACAQCTTVSKGGELLRCSRCKIMWYCSKECQKKHWPVHKKWCKESSPSMSKIICSFMANPLLLQILQIIFIFEFNLQERPILEQPFIARCDVFMDTADMTYIMQLVLGKLSPAEVARGAEGMLQLKAFVPLDASTAVDHTRMELWKNTRKGSAEQGYPNFPVGLVDFKMKGVEQTLSCGVVITDEAFKRVKAGIAFEFHSALIDLNSSVPLSRQSCLDFINMHIRSDKRNQLRLRAHMTKEDIDKLRGLADGGEDDDV